MHDLRCFLHADTTIDSGCHLWPTFSIFTFFCRVGACKAGRQSCQCSTISNSKQLLAGAAPLTKEECSSIFPVIHYQSHMALLIKYFWAPSDGYYQNNIVASTSLQMPPPCTAPNDQLLLVKGSHRRPEFCIFSSSAAGSGLSKLIIPVSVFAKISTSLL